MNVLQTLREFHAQDIEAVRITALPSLTGLTELAVAAQVRDLRKAGRVFVDDGYAWLVVGEPPEADEFALKLCSSCGEEKPLDQFPKDIRNRDGRQSNCRQCHLKSNSRSRAERRARQRNAGAQAQ